MNPMLDYATAGPLTNLSGIDPAVLRSVPTEVVEICQLTSSLVVQPHDAQALNLSAERFGENQIRPVDQLLDALLALAPTPLDVAREPSRRVIGTCRHFAVISCALLRHRRIPSRVRCGFATYFQPGQGVDHWITEYWHDTRGRWVRIDSEILGQDILEHPEDLHADEFLSGGEAWIAFRDGRIDAATFGVYGTENWGPAEIRGNAIKDLAALNKVEMLPWDEWGRMTASYNDETGSDYDDLLDTISATCIRDDPAELVELYAHDELRVPAELVPR
ncbi:transglutaminase-like domain-containing protein [Nocardia suismassiliense]|uniref:transglutaminase-like domain-containing protein n=1 Tax=Nocardia suismassiliense TaxID=2077092 RepID=UPI000D1D966F|nr:transglutaminase-like domain-containing protein [Nocardia suismassiliense]